MASTTVSGPPYAPRMAFLGGYPDLSTDVPICAVFLAIYLSCAVTSATIFQTNRRRGHLFIFSALFTGFCMARVLTCILRIVWAVKTDNVSLGIAATIFTNLGTFILFIVNLLLAQRILRARRPWLGWHPALKMAFIVAYILLGVVAILVIVFTILSYYTRDMNLLLAVRDVQLAASTYLLVFDLFPYLILLLAWLPGHLTDTKQTFGQGSIMAKTGVLLMLASLMVLDTGFKIGTAWTLTTYPLSNPPWYNSKACFYCFGFVLEVSYLVIVLALRVDLKFHVPDGSSRRKTYSTSKELRRTSEHSEA